MHYLFTERYHTEYLPVKFMGWTLVSARVLEEVQLVIVLGVPPLTGSYNLGDNFLAYDDEKLMLVPNRKARRRYIRAEQ